MSLFFRVAERKANMLAQLTIVADVIVRLIATKIKGLQHLRQGGGAKMSKTDASTQLSPPVKQ
jgi:hypothetical protein